MLMYRPDEWRIKNIMVEYVRAPFIGFFFFILSVRKLNAIELPIKPKIEWKPKKKNEKNKRTKITHWMNVNNQN